MDVETLDISALVADPANVRTHSQRNLEAIKASLQRFGQQKPIVVDGDNVVRAGNGTLEAARQLGWETINAVRSDLAGVEMTAYAIADNRTAELADWDWGALGQVVRTLHEDGFDLNAVGFEAAELGVLMNDAATGEDVGELDLEAPPIIDNPKEPTSAAVIVMVKDLDCLEDIWQALNEAVTPWEDVVEMKR